MANFLSDWQTAKKEFEAMTGKSKPKPNGAIAKAFNHSGLTGDLKTCDTMVGTIDAEKKDMAKKQKLIAAGKKHVAAISKSTTSYLKVLDTAIKDEVADNAGAKTTYAKGLKYLRSSLDAIEKSYEAKINGFEVAADPTTTTSTKVAKMVHKSLSSTIAIAKAGEKKIKATPTPATFDEIFKVSDNVARKVQVQLVAADNARKKGLLAVVRERVDPRYIADLMTPWQAGGKGEAVADKTWTSQQVLAQLAKFSKLLKLANAYCDDLADSA